MTDNTSLPLPAPLAAPSISPGRSSIWMFASLYFNTPGTTSKVVNAYDPVSLSASVKLFKSVDFPTLGNPTKATVASPAFLTP